MTVIIFQKFFAFDFAIGRHTKDLTFHGNQFTVDLVQSLDQLFDTRVVHAHFVHQLNHLGFELVVFLLRPPTGRPFSFVSKIQRRLFCAFAFSYAF